MMSNLIPLSKGQFAIVDDEDFDWLSQWKWYAHSTKSGFYAARRDNGGAKSKLVYMHRAIMNPPAGFMPDHRDGNGLNNQKSNLRNASHSQNLQNKRSQRGSTSVYRGVSWHTYSGKWRAHIKVPKQKQKRIGSFISEIDAARAYDHAALLHFGEFARLNFPEEHPQ